MGQSRPVDPIPKLSPFGLGLGGKQKNSNNQKTVKEKSRHVRIGTWNVRRGLIRRENEISQLLQSEDFDVLFLTETDTKRQNAADYKIKGYTTHIQAVAKDEDLVRILALTRDSCGTSFELKENLMQEGYASTPLFHVIQFYIRHQCNT